LAAIVHDPALDTHNLGRFAVRIPMKAAGDSD
jgi:hypothetical protein